MAVIAATSTCEPCARGFAQRGVVSKALLHCLRKEFGSQIMHDTDCWPQPAAASWRHCGDRYALACIRNSNRLWVSRWGCRSLPQLRQRGLAYPRPGKVPHFLFAFFSFVNNGPRCCEQAGLGSIICAPSTSLSVASLKRPAAHLKRGKSSEPRPGAAALTLEGSQK
jgi:hypothetical protein